MTGKTQKAKNVLEDFKKRVEITEEEKRKVMDEAIIEVHAENSEFLEKVNMPIKVFRGWYIIHTLFSMIDSAIDRKMEQKLAEKVSAYQAEEEKKKRKGF